MVPQIQDSHLLVDDFFDLRVMKPWLRKLFATLERTDNFAELHRTNKLVS
jgi:hypothetical protein